jgi:hypothetical protein
VPSRYALTVRRAFSLWPAWLPDSGIRVGDYGRLESGLFSAIGNLDQLAVKVEVARARAVNDHFFASKGFKHAATQLDGTLSTAASSTYARLEFNASFGVFVALRGCKEWRVRRSAKLAEQLAHGVRMGCIRRDTVVVNSVIEAKSAIIVISSKKGARLELRTALPGPDLLSQLDGEIHIVGESDLAYRAVIQGSCTPLFRLSRLARGSDLVHRGDRITDEFVLQELDARIGT